MAGVETNQDFANFADKLEDLSAEVPEILNNALDKTAKDLRREVCEQVKKEGSQYPGKATFDSRTSPYEPGGTNDSSSDNLHLVDTNAWVAKTVPAAKTAIVSPKNEVRDRAKYLAFGTTDHGPDGDKPMYFNVNGFTVIVGTFPLDNLDVDSIEDIDSVGASLQFASEPAEVSGVDSTMYFAKAIRNINRNNVLQENLEEAFREKIAEHNLVELAE